MIRSLLALATALLPVALAAQPAPGPTSPDPASPVPASPPSPKLIVVISVDQFSADLFAEYRARFTGGMKRMSDDVAFPAGYQSHAATETCPGHSTILTGDRPSRTGIIANNWIDQKTRPGSQVYCAEDETVPGSTFRAYTPSVAHLLVPTLGDRLKAVSPASRVVSVAGKDRAAIMLGGRATDAIWFLDPFKKRSFVTLVTQTTPPAVEVARLNVALDREVGRAAPPQRLPVACVSRDRAIALNAQVTVGAGKFARPAGDADAFRASPALDAATLTLATDLVQSMKLGRGPATDLLAVGLSSTDYVGHRYGTEGAEMCAQLTELDARLDTFFRALDRTGVDYLVMLTADHGGHDVPERNREQGLPDAERLSADLSVAKVGAALAAEFGLTGPVLRSADFGDVYLDQAVPAATRPRILDRAAALLRAYPQVAEVFDRRSLEVSPRTLSALPPELWPLSYRASASYHPARSGDLVVLLKPRVTPIAVATPTYVATHGSPYDYDRRVPILFWRRGLAPFEQPNSVETVDIAPTLASLIGLPLKPGDMDGRCLDIVAGQANNCPLVVEFK